MQVQSYRSGSMDDLSRNKEQHYTVVEMPILAEKMNRTEKSGLKSSIELVTDNDPDWITGLHLGIMMVALAIVMFLVLLDSAIIGATTPKITTDFESLNDVGWYGSAYSLASAVLQPLSGKIYTKLNNKWAYLTFFTIFELGSLVCGVSSSSTVLIIGRAIAGIGVSGLQNGSFTIIATSTPLQRRPTLNGILIGISQLGILLGPLIGGAFATYSTWRWSFYINLPLSAIVVGLLYFVRIPQPKTILPTEKSRVKALIKELDFVGFILLPVFSIQLLLALDWGGSEYAWNSSVIIGLLVGSMTTLVVFLFWQYRMGDRAVIQFSVMRNRVVFCACIVYSFLMSSLTLLSYYAPIYFQSVLNATAILSGVYTLPNIVSQVISSITSGILVSRWGYYLPWSIASGTLGAVATGLISTFSVDTSTGQWIAYQILFGAGCGIGIQMPILAVQNSLPDSDIPMAISLLMFYQNIVLSIWLSVASTIFRGSLQTYIPQLAPSVDPAVIIRAGARGIRDVVSQGPVLTQVLIAYSMSIDNAFHLATASLGTGLFFVWGMGWKDIRRNKAVNTNEMLA